VALVQEAGRQGKTLGKLLNEILDRYVQGLARAGGIPGPHICIVCGRPAVWRWLGWGQQRLYVCAFHKDVGKGLRALKRLEEPEVP